MDSPKIKVGDWITIGKRDALGGINGYVIDVHSDGSLGVGYCQNKIKAIKTDVIWVGEHWDFKCSGPDGSYLRGVEEHIVKNGPPHR
jgi:hypothetical protein